MGTLIQQKGKGGLSGTPGSPGSAGGRPARRELAPRVPAKILDELKRPWRDFLRKRHLNDSKAREAVVDVFLSVSEHLDVQQLHELARRRNPRVGFATVYRTLKLLEEAGLADVRHFGGQKGALYEVAAGKLHHDHLICEECGVIIEFVSEEVERLQDEIASRYGFVLSRHHHELYGRCSGCLAKH